MKLGWAFIIGYRYPHRGHWSADSYIMTEIAVARQMLLKRASRPHLAYAL